MDQLNKQDTGCTNCNLSQSRINALYREGDLNARLLLVALSPGKKKMRKIKGIGPSDHLLDKMFKKVHISRDFIYMTNLSKCMLPKNSRSKKNEIKSKVMSYCLNYDHNVTKKSGSTII